MNDYNEAQRLRESHCERKRLAHKCVGTVTIGPGYLCLDCPVCGVGGISVPTGRSIYEEGDDQE